MTSLDHILHLIADELEGPLLQHAQIDLIPPSDGWPILRLRIQPYRSDSARVNVWEDDGAIAIAAGKAARFDIETSVDTDMAKEAVAIVLAIAENGMTEKFVGGLSLEPDLTGRVIKRKPLVRQLRWCAYAC